MGRSQARRLGFLGGALNRRQFLRLGAGTALALPGAASVLAACGAVTAPSRPLGSLFGRDRPVAWPVQPEAKIPSGLPIERGATLRIYEWREYLSRSVVKDFARRYREYDVRFDITSFENREESIARVHRSDADFDIFFPTIDAIGGLVADRVLRPLNHDYLPNLANLWSEFRGAGPFYDAGARYTVPYTVFSSGVGWRDDLVQRNDAPDEARDPLGVLWNSRYRGKVGLYDAYREALGLALQHDGVTDLNTGSGSALAAAANALIAMIDAVDVRITADGAYEGLPQGEFAVHQAWSGDVLSARRFGGDPGGASQLRYWWPTDGTGVVGCDLLAILAGGRNPVLAHAFLDHILDVEVSMRNFDWNGYQPPITDATPDALSALRSGPAPAVPGRLRSALLTPQEFDRSQMLLPLAPAVDAQWIEQWSRFTARLGLTS